MKTWPDALDAIRKSTVRLDEKIGVQIAEEGDPLRMCAENTDYAVEATPAYISKVIRSRKEFVSWSYESDGPFCFRVSG